MSPARSESNDPRAARIRAGLQQAAYDLLEERPASSITVTDVVQRAGVSRAVFYQHFTDRDDVLAAAIIALLDEALPAALDSVVPPLDAIERVARLVAQRHLIYGNLFPGAAAERARWRLREGLRAPCRALVAGGAAEDLDLETLTSALVGLVVELLLEWAVDPRSARSPAAIRATVAALATRLDPSGAS